MQVLIIAKGLEPSQLSRAQIANIRQCEQQLVKDPREKEVYGITGQSTGCTVRCEVPNLQEADRLAGLVQVSGLPDVEMITLIPAQQWGVGLEELEKQAPAVPTTFEGTAVS